MGSKSPRRPDIPGLKRGLSRVRLEPVPAWCEPMAYRFTLFIPSEIRRSPRWDTGGVNLTPYMVLVGETCG